MSLSSGILLEIMPDFACTFGIVPHLRDWKLIENECGIFKERMDSA
jgi:hypothetical protein